MGVVTENTDLETIEIKLLLEAIFQQYGFDFRNYAHDSIKRRIWKRIKQEKLKSVSGLQEKVLHDPDCMERLLIDLSINVTSMFRDPGFFLTLRGKVIPLLRTYPFARIWVAGCATGEEAYSLAILMQEEGLLDRCIIYATDMSEAVLRTAKAGIVPLSSMREYTTNYINAGGKQSFSDYYTAKYDDAIICPEIRNTVVFAQHNLATDGSFNEFNVILCRNVMIYFDRKLQEKAHSLIYESLSMFGVLGLGDSEGIRFSPHEPCYEAIDGKAKLYRKVA